VRHHDRVSQPQDAAGASGPADGLASSSGSAWTPPPASAPPGYGAPAGPSYGAPGEPAPNYGAPPGQAYPGYPQQAGYGQRYPAYGAQATGKDPALAEWWRRLSARIIDGLILAVIFSPLWIPPWRTFIRTLRNITNSYPAGTQLGSIPAARNAIATAEGHLVGDLFVVAVLFYLAAFAYDWIQHGLWGQTIGKRALGTEVVTADGHAKVGAGAAGGRAAIYALTPLVPFVGWLFDLLNELWLTWDPRRQCLHDKAAHTVVIKKDHQGSYPQPGSW
jgi:uncharacterized RDD family membrane protein YckC